MADITRLARLLNGTVRGLDLTSNTLVVQSIKVGAGQTELTQTILDRLLALQNGSDVDATYHTHDGRYRTETELASTSNGEGASMIGIEDSAAQFTATTVEGALAEALDAAQAAQADVDDLVSLSGVAANSVNLGTFTGTAIPDNQTIKQALQALETYGEANRSLIQNFEWQESVLTIEVDSAEIVAPATGARYLIAGTGLNDFSGENNKIAEWDGAAWVFTAPSVGMYVAVDDENDGLYLFGGSSWDKKFFEATTASTGLTKSGFDIRLADAVANSGVVVSSGAISIALATGSGLEFVSNELAIDFDVAASLADLASTANGDGASLIGIEDSAANFTATTVEAALAELATSIASVSSDSVTDSMVLGEDLTAVSGIRAMRFMKAADAGFTAGRVIRADNDATTVDDFYVMGLAIVANEDVADTLAMVKAGKMTATAHGLTVGQPFYLGASGALTSTAPTADASAIVKLGMVKDANTLEVQIQVMGVN